MTESCTPATPEPRTSDPSELKNLRAAHADELSSRTRATKIPADSCSLYDDEALGGTAGRATASVAATSVGVNVLIGEQYLSILLSGETFKPVYDKLGLHPRNLSRTLEDAGTVINPLVPWSVCGVFIANALGVPVLNYLPYAFFCYLSLILTLLFGWTGLTLSKK